MLGSFSGSRINSNGTQGVIANVEERMTRKRGKRWSHCTGPYGCRVTVYEEINGVIYARESGGKPRSLSHRSRERAKVWARERQAKLALGQEIAATPTPTVRRVFGLYLEYHSPMRTPATQAEDQRRAEMWGCALGPQKDLNKLTRGEWERFARDRWSGAIDPRGRPVPELKRRPVRARTVGADQEWLRSVIRWAVTWQDVEGRYVMRENPMRGYEIAKEKNPKRPVATQDRYEAVRAVSDRVLMEVRRDSRRFKVRSYLSEILDIANGTGRRISAVLALQFADLRLSEGPFGSIQWREDTDKTGKAWLTPISREVRAAIDRVLAERPGVGRAYLFASPRNQRRPVSKDLASDWLQYAERLAGLEPLDGSLWHAYRRKWATERKHLPDKDVAAAGGWSDLTSLKTAYQQVDMATLYRVVTEPAELREASNER